MDRDPAAELLSRLPIGDWVRIWCTRLPRHMPRGLARQVQSRNTTMFLRNVVASVAFGVPVWLAVVLVLLPDTSAARMWAWASALVFAYIGISVSMMYRLRDRHRFSAARYNVLGVPNAVLAGLVWGVLPAVVGTDQIGRFYLATVTVTVISLLGVTFHAGHWPLGVLYSSMIATGSIVTFYRSDVPEVVASSTMIGLAVAAVVVLSAVGCIALVRMQLQTVLAQDRQLTIDLLLNSYEHSGNDWVWSVDEDATFWTMPHRMEVAGRGDPRVRVGQTLLELVRHDPVAVLAIQNSTSFETTVSTEGPDGRGEMRLWGRPVIVDRRCLGFQGVGSDLGAAKRAAEAERAAERLDAMVSVTSGINHDFNNQLASVLSAVELASYMVRGDDDATEYLNRAIEACMRSRSLTADLAAALGLKTSSESSPVGLVGEVSNVIEDVAHIYPGAAFDLVENAPLKTTPVIAIADPSHVRRSVRNLVENACQANAQHPASAQRVLIEVTTDVMDDTEVACVRVYDTGPGVDEEYRDRIFEPFFTTRDAEGGTGMGLAVASGLAREAGGSVRFETTPNGAVFELTLPLAANPTVALGTPGGSSPWRPDVVLTQGTFLLVEDDDLVAPPLIAWIEMGGASAVWVGTVAEALDLIADPQHRFVCLITDVLLPDGEGFDVVAALRRRDPDAAVVYISGYSPHHPTDLDGVLHGPFVPKPFAFSELLAALRSVGVVDRGCE